MGSCTPEWGNDRADETRCPKRLREVCDPGEVCQCRVAEEGLRRAVEARRAAAAAAAEAMRATPSEGMTVAKLQEAGQKGPYRPAAYDELRDIGPGGIVQLPAEPVVPDTLRREALTLSEELCPPAKSPGELVAAAYMIGIFLHTGKA